MRSDYATLLSMLASEQEQSTKGVKEEVLGYIKEYTPIAIDVAKELFEVYKKYVDNEEFHIYRAKSLMNDYQAYIDAGFTEDQAFTLLLNEKTQRNDSLKRISYNSTNRK